ncbi:MAG: O-acetylhomoserine aminocarboxypropyltransferase/cysteine synthase family protein [Sphaerochaetaceae bacterium]|jgi:O-acetylhomoserine (thiol)-lyase
MEKRDYHFETLQVHAGQEKPDSATGARAVPIYATTSFVFDDTRHATALFDLSESGNIYTRIMNPTTSVFEERINALEGGVGSLALASGQAAITLTIQNLAHSGHHIVASRSIYGGTHNLFSRTLKESGIECTFFDASDLDQLADAIKENTQLVFIESIGNPNADLIDIEEVARITHLHNIPLVVDNTFATPYLMRPFEHGADIVVHSATKFLGGHGNSIGGVIVDGGTFDWKQSGKFPWFVDPDPSYHGVKYCEASPKGAFILRARVVLLRDYGSALSPFNSFLFLQGLETLSLRVERHVENTLKVVTFLDNHPQVETVNHPSLSTNPTYHLYEKYLPKGGASIFTFVVKGGYEAARNFTDKLEIFSLLANVADVKSLVIHPASTTHSQMTQEELLQAGIEEGTIRLSIGTEHIDDIIADLDQALTL